jgi:hypothetical protein
MQGSPSLPRRDVPSVHRWAGISALGAFGVFTAANVLWAFEQPAPGSSGAELIDFYTDLSTRIIVGGFASMFSIAIFVAFAAALRPILSALEDGELLANAAFGGTILGLAAGLGAESVNTAAALRADDGELTEPLALALFDISYVFGSYATGIGFGVATLAIGLAALRSGALLPRWLGFTAVAIGVAMVTPLAGYVLGEYTLAPCFVLFAVLGVLLLRGSALRGRAAEARLAPPAEGL